MVPTRLCAWLFATAALSSVYEALALTNYKLGDTSLGPMVGAKREELSPAQSTSPYPSKSMCVPFENKPVDYMIERRMVNSGGIDAKPWPRIASGDADIEADERESAALEGARALRSALTYISGPSCSFSRSIQPRAMENGVGSTIFSLVKPLLHALAYGYCVRTPKDFRLYADVESGGRWEYFFRAFSETPSVDQKSTQSNKSGPVGAEMFGDDASMWYVNSHPFASLFGAEMRGKDTETSEDYENLLENDLELLREAVDPVTECVPWWENQCDYYCDDVYAEYFRTHGGTTADGGAVDIEELRSHCAHHFSRRGPGVTALHPLIRKLGWFYLTSHLVSFIATPSARVAQAVHARGVGLGWRSKGKPVLALHVRQGDACLKDQMKHHNRRCSQLADYMPHVRAIRDRYGVHRVYLATDGARAMASARKERSFSWLIPAATRTSTKKPLSTEIEIALHNGVVNGTTEMINVLVDIHTMARAQALVGKFTSNIARMAYMIGFVASGDCYHPLRSLDAGWCFDHAVQSGNSDFGKFWC